jgi:hypothetical protein
MTISLYSVRILRARRMHIYVFIHITVILGVSHVFGKFLTFGQMSAPGRLDTAAELNNVTVTFDGLKKISQFPDKVRC